MLAAPGEQMNVHEQNPPTDLTVFLNKSKFDKKSEQYVLPEPLYDPINEKFALEFSFKFNIDKSLLPFELKTIISQVCLPSSLIISILSSGKTSITDKPPPFT